MTNNTKKWIALFQAAIGNTPTAGVAALITVFLIVWLNTVMFMFGKLVADEYFLGSPHYTRVMLAPSGLLIIALLTLFVRMVWINVRVILRRRREDKIMYVSPSSRFKGGDDA